jgi:predicted molibdopterin-dependent oxidoreductase YjgC
VGATGDAVKFTISKEKCPNRRGIEMILDASGGTTLTFEEFSKRGEEGDFAAAWIVGGYTSEWINKKTAKFAEKFEFLVLQDMFESVLSESASIVLPACAWAEREGSFVNIDGLVQPFDRAIKVPDGARRDGQYLYEIAGFEGLYRAERVRELMAATISAMSEIRVAPPEPVHAH